MNKLFFSAVIIVFLGLFLTVQAQSELNEKLREIKGDANKVTINADGKDHVFTGEEAEKILKILKRGSDMKVRMIKSEGDGNSEIKIKKIKVKKDGEEVEDLIWIDEDGNKRVLGEDDLFEFHEDEMIKDKKHKKVKVEIKDDSKKVTITTIEDGKEIIKILEGEDAEKYIDKMKADDELIINEEVKKDGKKYKKIIIEKKEKEVN